MLKKCSNCGSEGYRSESKFCKNCGTQLPDHVNMADLNQNICSNQSCGYHQSGFIYPNETRFCDICGSKTSFGLRG